MPLDPDLLSILVCPACRGSLMLKDHEEGLCCLACAKVYPVRDGIPVMLAEEAIALADWEKGQREAPAARKHSL